MAESNFLHDLSHLFWREGAVREFQVNYELRRFWNDIANLFHDLVISKVHMGYLDFHQVFGCVEKLCKQTPHELLNSLIGP